MQQCLTFLSFLFPVVHFLGLCITASLPLSLSVCFLLPVKSSSLSLLFHFILLHPPLFFLIPRHSFSTYPHPLFSSIPSSAISPSSLILISHPSLIPYLSPHPPRPSPSLSASCFIHLPLPPTSPYFPLPPSLVFVQTRGIKFYERFYVPKHSRCFREYKHALAGDWALRSESNSFF